MTHYKHLIVFSLICLLASSMPVAAKGGKIAIVNPTCEYQQNPLLLPFTEQPRFGWQLQSSENGIEQSAYAVRLFEIQNGKEKIIWESGKISSSKSQHIPYSGTTKLTQGKKYSWQVQIWDSKNKATKWSEKQSFRFAPATIEEDVNWIGAITYADCNLPEGRRYHGLNNDSEAAKRWRETHPLSKQSIYLRKDFSVSKPIKEAVIYISGLGHYELSLNGKTLGGDIRFAPLWSDYDKTVYYNAFDVTDAVSRDNAVGVLLGNGFFNEQGGRYVKMQVSFGPPTLFFKMVVTYTDGTSSEITSDKSWKYSFSPLVFNDMYGGEDYDARLEQNGWNSFGFDDADWKPVVVQTPPKGKLTAQTANPVKIMERFPIHSSKKIGDSYLLDMWQNLSGFPEIKVKGKKGDKIRLTVGESLEENGLVKQAQSGGPYYYEYTLKGDGEESWAPRFSYYGYRYIQVDGAKLDDSSDSRDLPILTDIKSCFVYNSVPPSGTFTSSNEIFSQTHKLIVNAIKSNMHAVFTDCPHREKLGWLEQNHLNGPGLFYNFNQSRLMPKVMQDIRDAQLPNGLVPDIAPEYVIFDGGFRDSPEWGSAAVFIPFMYYHYYGDDRLIREYYDVMKKYVDYLSTTAKDHIVSHGLGDWCDYHVDFPYGESRNTPIPLSATTHYYMDINYLVQAAEMLDKKEDVAFYSKLREEVKKAYNDTFFNKETKQYGTGSQASNAMPLFAGIVEPENKQAVLDNLVKNIEEKGYKLSTGDVGNRYLFQALAENNLNEVMFKMHNHYEVPGYGFQLQFGVTALTELWDPRKGASWNHFMMGQIEEWFYKSLAGIKTDKTVPNSGFQHIVIAPQTVGDLKHVKASYNTLYGTIAVEWKISENKFTLNVAIPANCRAKVYLPNENEYKEIESGNYSFQKTI